MKNILNMLIDFFSLQKVELLVMKALSLKLVKGTIDQVEQFVQMNWVQPRVLDKEQVCLSCLINLQFIFTKFCE